MSRIPTSAASALAATLAVTGCAGYAGSVAEVRSALLAGDKERALEETNHALGVGDPSEFPEELDGDAPLLVLERATIKQGLDRFASSASDFRVADKHLELLDLKNDTAGNIGKYLFSDDVTTYKAPSYEKLLLNTLNMLNYLAVRDLEGARVEARRLTIMQDYLTDADSGQSAMLSLGSYLAGFTFEVSGDDERALTYYGEALSRGMYPSLRTPVQRLSACNSYRNEQIERLLEELGPAADCRPASANEGTVLVVAAHGLAPNKEAVRLPIGAALVIAGGLLSSQQSSQVNAFAAKGLLTFVNFPQMRTTPGRFSEARVAIDGNSVPTSVALDVTERVLEAWDSMQGKLMLAAITRTLSRLVAGQATQMAVEKASGNGVGGLLAGLAVQGALTAADTPDTRSWVTLPSAIHIARADVPAGSHQIEVGFSGPGGLLKLKRTIEVPPGGYVVLPVATMR